MATITKGPEQRSNYARPYVKCLNARGGLSALLSAMHLSEDDTVLLPSYIGWSPREGSGVLDPILASKVHYRFYKVDRLLQVDLDHLAHQLSSVKHIRLVLIIHYFGYVDPNYHRIVDMSHRQGAYILEDEAHAMFTDLVGGLAGREGDFSLFSLHKMLPLTRGGMLLANNLEASSVISRISSYQDIPSPFQYDLTSIANIRRHNAARVAQLTKSLSWGVTPLRKDLADGEVPQTYPVLINNTSRDTIYHQMNSSGFGVVSLYHTLADQIKPDMFPDAHAVSRKILNIPVHQDITNDAIDVMMTTLAHNLHTLADTPKME